MKKLIALIVVLFVLLMLAFIVASAESLPLNFTPDWVVDHQYAKVTVVDHIDVENDLVYFSIPFDTYWDENGELQVNTYWYYIYEGIEDLEVGDLCGLLMNDNDTPYIVDDYILSVTFSGWTYLLGD